MLAGLGGWIWVGDAGVWRDWVVDPENEFRVTVGVDWLGCELLMDRV